MAVVGLQVLGQYELGRDVENGVAQELYAVASLGLRLVI